MIYNGEMSIPDYNVLLKNFVKNNYVTKCYDNVEQKKRHIILRHDIDIVPSDTINLAEIENNYNYKAYYFFLVNTDFYNVNSKNTQEIIKKIISLGHHKGLHFDESIMNKSKSNIDSIIDKECKVLENITQKKITTVSFHRPSKKLMNLDREIAGRIHTYMPAFFSNISYVSDSRGTWKYGHPLNHDFYQKGTAAQILIHPEWWNLEKDIGRDKAIKVVYSKLNDNIRKSLESNIKNFSAYDLKFN